MAESCKGKNRAKICGGPSGGGAFFLNKNPHLLVFSYTRGFMSDKKKKIFEIDLKEIDEMQDVIFEYFYIISELLKDRDLEIEKITLNASSTKISVEGYEREIDSEESTEEDFEWI